MTGATVTEPIGVLIVDDQPLGRRAAATLVRASPGLVIAAEAGSGEQAVALAAGLCPGLVLMDVRLPGIDGVEATRRILARCPSARVLLTSTYELADLPDMAECGAIGFTRKQDLDVPTLLRHARAGG